VELREILRRLRIKQGIREIHRDTGYSRELIRKVRDLAKKHGWLESSKLVKESEIAKRFYSDKTKSHPLDRIKDKIKEWVECGYTYIVITQLINEKRYDYNEITIRRYIKDNFPKYKKPVCRRQFDPGENAEVDFGYMGLMYDESEKRNRKVWLFSMRLNYSRYCYRELVCTQQMDVFFQCHIHAFEYFGGVPRKVVCDNLKAAIIKASLQEPLINKSYQMLAEHYGFLISSNQPAKPEHKGGVEKDVDYVKRNFYPLFIENQKEKGRQVAHFSDCQKALEKWVIETDLKHQIKYTNATPESLFSEEKNVLFALPLDRWDRLIWYQPKVGDDWKVQINKAFYSVPYQYIGKQVTAYQNSTEVVIFYNYEEIARHRRAKHEWERVNNAYHGPPNYQDYLDSTSVGVKRWAKIIGNPTSALVEIILNQKNVDGLRPARALCALSKSYGNSRLNKACQRALHYKLYSFSSVKQILRQNLDQLPLDQTNTDLFQSEMPLKTEPRFNYARSGRYFND
jgi:transposase